MTLLNQKRDLKSECDIRWAMPAQVQILFVAILVNSYDVRVVKEADLNSIILLSLFFVCVYVV